MSNILDHQNWLEGDFALVSAGGVRFYIDSHYLMSARCAQLPLSPSPTLPTRTDILSSVFRDMIRDCNGERSITFLDPDLEGRDNLALFLHLITTAKLNLPLIPSAVGNIDGLLDLFDLMDKYACEMPRAMALNWLLSNPCDLTPLQLFTVGANLDNMNLCAEALRPCPDFKRLRDELNPRKLSLAQYQRMGTQQCLGRRRRQGGPASLQGPRQLQAFSPFRWEGS